MTNFLLILYRLVRGTNIRLFSGTILRLFSGPLNFVQVVAMQTKYGNYNSNIVRGKLCSD